MRSSFLLESFEPRRLFASLAFFMDSAYVAATGSAANLRDELVGLGHTVKTFSGTDTASFKAALAGADALVMPDLANDRPILNNTTQQAIRDFVTAGGGYLSAGNTSARNSLAISTVFALPSINIAGAYNTTLVGVDTPIEPANANGTAFAGGPSPIRDTGGVSIIADLTSTIANGKSIYWAEGNEGHSNGSKITVVAALPYAQRYPIVFLGRDWVRGGPSGTEDNGWKSVLHRAVQQVAKSPASTAPTAPASLSASAASTTSIQLNWQDRSASEGGFEIERATSAGGPFTRIATVPADTTSYTNGGLSPSTTYYYRVRAVNTAGDSAYTSIASATTLTTVPAAPTTLIASPASTTSIQLNWQDQSSNESGFQIERAASAGGPFTLVTITAANATSYTNTGLTAGTTYYYRIRATNSGGNSAYTGVVSATTSANATGFTVSLTRTGTLYVNGTDEAQRIRLYIKEGKLRVGTDDSNSGFAKNKVKRINIAAKGGNDSVLINAQVRGAFIDGGDGNDLLIGGNGNDTILGQAGDDTIIGGLGSDSIDGGTGNDLIYAADGFRDVITGGTGTDILLGDDDDTATLIEELL